MTLKPTVWTTKAGQVIPIRDMGDAHLANTLRLLHRCAKRRVERFTLSPNTFGGEMASESFFDAQQRALEEPEEAEESVLSSQVPQYAALVAEASRRGLPWEEGQ